MNVSPQLVSPSAGVLRVSDPRVGPPLYVNFNGKLLPIGLPPSLKQWAFLSAGEMEQLYGGSKSGGKSVALCQKIVAVGCAIPGNRIGLLRRELTDLKKSTLVTFFRTCPPDLILGHNKSDRIVRLRTAGASTEIIYGGVADFRPDDMSQKGIEAGAFAIDEPSEIDPDVYLQLLAQLRWTLPDGSFPPFQMWLGSNPEPGWLEDKFGHLISRASEAHPVVSDGQRIYVMALPKDNPYLPPHWEAVLRAQKDLPPAWVKKYLEGSWEASEGQVYKEFDRAVHCIAVPPAAYLASLCLVAAVDHATTGTTCMVVDGIDPDGNVIALGSYYERNRLVSEHAKGMQSLADEWVDRCGKREEMKAKAASDQSIYPAFHAFEYVLIDPSTQAKVLQSRNEMYSFQDEYRRNGIPTVAAWNAVEAGINLMSEYLHVKPGHIHPFKQVRGSPSFFIVADENCDGIREIVGWKRTISVRGAIRYVGADHWLDCQRYIVMSRPEPPQMTVTDVVAMDVLAQRAKSAMDRWSAKFGRTPGENNWFGGNIAPSKDNTWFPWQN